MGSQDRQPAEDSGVDVCVVGSINLDLVITAPRLPAAGETVLGGSYAEHPGGKGLNQAVAACRAGASTTLCACVGDDEAGRLLRAVACDAGIVDAQIAVAAGEATGRALIAVAAGSSENLIVVAPGANSVLAADAAMRAAGAARVVLAQLEVPVASVVAAFTAARAAEAITILNPAPADIVTSQLLALCDIVIANEHEARLMGGAGRIQRAGAGQVIVTHGASGALLTTADGREQHVPAYAVDAVDTTAAGDAFCGAFAAAIAMGRDLEGALRFAAAAGALATTVAGAVPSLPRRGRIDALVDCGEAVGGAGPQRMRGG